MAETTTGMRTPLYEMHRAEGAKIVDFAGWDMPVEYTGIKHEHTTVRQDAGLFDLSHMGEIEVTGPGAFDWVQSLVTNDLDRCAVGQAQYTTMCNEAGRVLDDMIVYRLEHKLYLVVNASNRPKIVAWMQSRLPAAGVDVQDLSRQTALIAVQGPNAQAKVQPLFSRNLEEIRYYHFVLDESNRLGVPILLSRTGYTGEDGFELYLPWGDAEKAWKAFREAGVAPIGLGARDTLRLESGYALYGHEIDEATSPLDAGLGWVVKLDKPDFVGKEALVKEKEAGLKRTLVGLVMEGRAIPREGYRVMEPGREVGRITSGTYSPTLSKGIALASVECSCRSEGTLLEVDVRGRGEGARVTRPPFVRGSLRRN
ncbi:MAG: glycine cleavage system aminomethyltransferase GcvT [Candidatus Eremiobacterota bacterium]